MRTDETKLLGYLFLTMPSNRRGLPSLDRRLAGRNRRFLCLNARGDSHALFGEKLSSLDSTEGAVGHLRRHLLDTLSV